MFHCYLSLPECKLIGFKSIRLDLAWDVVRKSRQISQASFSKSPSPPQEVRHRWFLYKMAPLHCSSSTTRSGRSGSAAEFQRFEKKKVHHTTLSVVQRWSKWFVTISWTKWASFVFLVFCRHSSIVPAEVRSLLRPPRNRIKYPNVPCLLKTTPGNKLHFSYHACMV